MKKYLIDPIKQRFLALWVTQEQVEEWANKWKFFFILALGRSGTAFTANLLNNPQGVHVFHEPAFEDFFASLRAFYNPQHAERYMPGFRKKEIYLRMRNTTPGIYGEVNSALRRHVEGIKRSFPGAALVYLVRDGRDVVRSMMSRRTMTIKDPFTFRIHPPKTDPWISEWNKFDRFARICWFWETENSYLRRKVGNPVQFEKILSNYDYFFNGVLKPCGINVDRKIWETTVLSPRNTTQQFKMSKWDDWTSEQRRIFVRICGDEMENCGYKI